MVPRQDRPLQTWKTFLRNHMEGIASIDLFVVPTIAFEQLFAFFVLGHGRRQLLWIAVTRNPSVPVDLSFHPWTGSCGCGSTGFGRRSSTRWSWSSRQLWSNG